MFRNAVMLLFVAMLTTSCARLGAWMLAQFVAQAMEDLLLEEQSVLSGDHRVSFFFRDGISPVVLLHGFTADRSMYFGPGTPFPIGVTPAGQPIVETTPWCFPMQEEAKLGNPILRDRHPRAHG